MPFLLLFYYRVGHALQRRGRDHVFEHSGVNKPQKTTTIDVFEQSRRR